LVRKHPDNKGDLLKPEPDDLFMAVLVDDWDGMVGQIDVVGESRHFGTLAARCGAGIWLSRADLDRLMGRPVEKMGRSELGDDFVRAVQKSLADLVRGRFPDDRKDEDDPNYHEHLELVGRALAAVERVRNL